MSIDKKYVFVKDGAVYATIVGLEGNGISFPTPEGSTRYIVEVDNPVAINWTVIVTPDGPVFSPPEPVEGE